MRYMRCEVLLTVSRRQLEIGSVVWESIRLKITSSEVE